VKRLYIIATSNYLVISLSAIPHPAPKRAHQKEDSMTGDFNKFTHWLRKRGPTLLAFELGITVRAIWAWIYEEAQPRSDLAKRLVELGEGKISMDDIYAGEPKPRYKRKDSPEVPHE
jgi:hypothetical protein